MRRAIYRAEQLRKMDPNFVFNVSWGGFWNSDPIKDIKDLQERIYELMDRQIERDYEPRGIFQFGGWGSSKTLMKLLYDGGSFNSPWYRMARRFEYIDAQRNIAMIGPNLRKLGWRLTRKHRNKAQAEELKPQRQQWRQQERKKSTRLPGRQ